jgi:hypothetical protein
MKFWDWVCDVGKIKIPTFLPFWYRYNEELYYREHGDFSQVQAMPNLCESMVGPWTKINYKCNKCHIVQFV